MSLIVPWSPLAYSDGSSPSLSSNEATIDFTRKPRGIGTYSHSSIAASFSMTEYTGFLCRIPFDFHQQINLYLKSVTIVTIESLANDHTL